MHRAVDAMAADDRLMGEKWFDRVRVAAVAALAADTGALVGRRIPFVKMRWIRLTEVCVVTVGAQAGMKLREQRRR
jgi:hypothetical protein